VSTPKPYVPKQHINKKVRYAGSFTYQEIIVCFLVLVFSFILLDSKFGWIAFIPIAIVARIKKANIKKGNEDVIKDWIAKISYKKSFEDRRHLFQYLIKKDEH
jgi:hypothetical protein